MRGKDAANATKIVEKAQKFIGTEYDFLFNSQDDKNVYCHELTARCLESAGYKIQKYPATFLGIKFKLLKNNYLADSFLQNDSFEKIIEQGAVITEYEPKQEPCGKQFIARNRIISGIAIGTLVVEAHYRSGTAITAKLALEQRRKLFSIPNQVDNKYGVGTNNLIRKGAILTRYVEDIIKEFPFLKSKPICEENKAINIPTEYQDICKILSTETIHINEISKKLKLDSNQTSAKLMMMELDGYVEKMPGNFFKMKE